jgi:hypothetical protein
MAEHVPTQVGDVLILRTERTFSVHAVGRVSKDGQQEFRGQADVKYVGDLAAALAEARAFSCLDDGFSFWIWIQASGLRFQTETLLKREKPLNSRQVA